MIGAPANGSSKRASLGPSGECRRPMRGNAAVGRSPWRHYRLLPQVRGGSIFCLYPSSTGHFLLVWWSDSFGISRNSSGGRISGSQRPVIVKPNPENYHISHGILADTTRSTSNLALYSPCAIVHCRHVCLTGLSCRSCCCPRAMEAVYCMRGWSRRGEPSRTCSPECRIPPAQYVRNVSQVITAIA